MALTDAERSTLVEELAEAFRDQHTDADLIHPGDSATDRNLALACLPVIDRMLAARDLDELLADLEWLKMEGLHLSSGGWWASITVALRGRAEAVRHFRGEGDTPTLAIAAAIRMARERVK